MRIARSLLVVVGLAGCPGSAPPNPNTQPDAPTADATEETTLLLTGKVMDYFGGVSVKDAALATDGLDPAQIATSADDGGYSLEIPVGSKLFVVATKPAYRPTRNQAITVADASLSQDVYVSADQDVKNQYTAVGATPAEGTAFVIAELRHDDNTPLDGIPLTNIVLRDAQDQPVAGIQGPYAFNASGSLDSTLTMAMTYSGRSRIALLDVPPGTYTLAVTHEHDGAQHTTTTPITATGSGTTLALSGGGMGPGTVVADPTFAMHVYPKLQRAAQGGLGCANCHTLSGSASFLKYDEPAATVLANLNARPGVIDTTTPANSLFVVRPLYEQPPTPQDHPNATFLNVDDADYKLFLSWITNGAKL